MLVGECFPIVLTVMQQLFSGVEELECFHWKVSVEGFSECCVSLQLVGASLSSGSCGCFATQLSHLATLEFRSVGLRPIRQVT